MNSATELLQQLRRLDPDQRLGWVEKFQHESHLSLRNVVEELSAQDDYVELISLLLEAPKSEDTEKETHFVDLCECFSLPDELFLGGNSPLALPLARLLQRIGRPLDSFLLAAVAEDACDAHEGWRPFWEDPLYRHFRVTPLLCKSWRRVEGALVLMRPAQMPPVRRHTIDAISEQVLDGYDVCILTVEGGITFHPLAGEAGALRAAIGSSWQIEAATLTPAEAVAAFLLDRRAPALERFASALLAAIPSAFEQRSAAPVRDVLAAPDNAECLTWFPQSILGPLRLLTDSTAGLCRDEPVDRSTDQAVLQSFLPPGLELTLKPSQGPVGIPEIALEVARAGEVVRIELDGSRIWNASFPQAWG